MFSRISFELTLTRFATAYVTRAEDSVFFPHSLAQRLTKYLHTNIQEEYSNAN